MTKPEIKEAAAAVVQSAKEQTDALKSKARSICGMLSEVMASMPANGEEKK